MNLTRITLRIEVELKKEAKRLALSEDMSFQAIINLALRDYLSKHSAYRDKRIVFRAIDLGVPLDNLTRDDIYGTPDLTVCDSA